MFLEGMFSCHPSLTLLTLVWLHACDYGLQTSFLLYSEDGSLGLASLLAFLSLSLSFLLPLCINFLVGGQRNGFHGDIFIQHYSKPCFFNPRPPTAPRHPQHTLALLSTGLRSEGSDQFLICPWTGSSASTFQSCPS